MNQRLVKRMFDACYMAKRTRDMLPPLPEGVQPSYIHCLDCILGLEEKGKQVRISDLSEFLNIPRPGVTRTIKEMEAKGYLRKIVSEEDGRIIYISITDKGELLSEKYDKNYYARLCKHLSDITDDDADCMIHTIEKFYKVMSERSVDIE